MIFSPHVRLATRSLAVGWSLWVGATLGCSGGSPEGQQPSASINSPAKEDEHGADVTPQLVQLAPSTQQADGSPATFTPPADPPAQPPTDNRPVAKNDRSPHPVADPASQEKLFVGWPKPKAALLLTGQQHGYIEPCGCTGLANQKGGLARRHTFLKQLQDQLAGKGWDVVPMDVGNQVKRYGVQAEIKLQVSFDGLRKMGYQAIAFGADDLRLRPDTILAEANSTPFVCANVSLFDESLMPHWRVIETPAGKIGVTSVLGTEELAKVESDDVLKKTPAQGLAEAWPQLEAAKCDLYVLLAHASLEESRQLARQFPKFNLIVTAGGAGEPTHEPEKLEGTDAVMVQVGVKGMYASVVGWHDDGELRYQRVPLDDRYTDSAAMRDLMAAYQNTLKLRGLEGLEIRPISHPSGKQFVGSAACADCHAAEFDIWKKSPHAHATESLVHPGERSDVARHFDPECLSCHVTGWNPQKYFPYTSGYLDLEKTAHLHGSGCENCHGPGSAHVAAENGDVDLNAAAIEQLRAAMRLPLERAEQKCMDCHDLDNSPDFHQAGAFERYWKKIAH